eukprot:scaffold183503_cov18-Prasinocladus_malaysianus.AAC.1
MPVIGHGRDAWAPSKTLQADGIINSLLFLADCHAEQTHCHGRRSLLSLGNTLCNVTQQTIKLSSCWRIVAQQSIKN